MGNDSKSTNVCRGNRSGIKCIAVAILLVFFGIVAWVSAREFFSSDKTSHVVENPSTARRVYALGRLEPRGTVLRISAPSGNEGSRIERLLVEEGQDVQAGELLAILDVAVRRESAVRESEARLHSAEAKLNQIRAGAKAGDISAQVALVDKMEAEIQMARKELERARQLIAQKVMTAENLEQKELSFERAKLESQRARATLESLREVRDVDVQLQEREVAAAAAVLDRAREELEAAKVRSPITGRILKIHTRPGERVGDRGILQLGDVAHMQAVAEVFEGDVHGLRIGQPALVRLSSDGREKTGTIEQIGLMVARKDVLSNDPVSDTDARVLEVRIAISPAEIPQIERLSNARVEVLIELTGDEDIPSNETRQPADLHSNSASGKRWKHRSKENTE